MPRGTAAFRLARGRAAGPVRTGGSRPPARVSAPDRRGVAPPRRPRCSWRRSSGRRPASRDRPRRPDCLAPRDRGRRDRGRPAALAGADGLIDAAERPPAGRSRTDGYGRSIDGECRGRASGIGLAVTGSMTMTSVVSMQNAHR